jgi:predicted N-acetyltransferase YhbS
MEVREASIHEYEKIYEQGYREWAKGRSLEQYIRDNQKEESLGRRYVLADDNENIVASLMLLKFASYLFGIGSIVVEPEYRGQGAGKKLIQECLDRHPDAAFMLYSEIGTEYYERFGFRALPAAYQNADTGICMVRAEDELYKQVLNEPIPAYF